VTAGPRNKGTKQRVGVFCLFFGGCVVAWFLAQAAWDAAVATGTSMVDLFNVTRNRELWADTSDGTHVGWRVSVAVVVVVFSGGGGGGGAAAALAAATTPVTRPHHHHDTTTTTTTITTTTTVTTTTTPLLTIRSPLAGCFAARCPPLTNARPIWLAFLLVLLA
jgi:hypothetical protein